MWGFHFLYLSPCLMVANCYISLSIYLYIYLIYIYIYLCSLPQCLLLYIMSPLTLFTLHFLAQTLYVSNISVSTRPYMYAYTYIYSCIGVYIYAYICTWFRDINACMRIYIFVCTYVYMHMCVYIYICMYILSCFSL